MGGNADDQRYGRWPRRLLHVPTMTSLEWQPGNRYGASICPPYNTLSYTWGRFVLREEQMPHVQALPVRFQGHRTWSIPRINPQHFTVDEFQAAVQLAVQVNETTEKNVEHLWLDIACIDQEHARTKHAEINRQAIIFQHAHTSSVWLTHIDECTLTEAIHRLRGVHNPWSSITLPDGRVYAIPHQSKDMEIETAKHWLRIWLQPVQDAIQKALLDTAASTENQISFSPWFSSLWTLQEAYLRPNACLLPRNCKSTLNTTSHLRSRPHRLMELTTGLAIASRGLLTCSAVRIGPEATISNALKTISQSGVVEMRRASPFAIYAASHQRQASNPMDRVYGIMQVFGFRLALRNAQNKIYKLPELQEILSEKILLQYPVESQLYAHTQAQQPGSKWKLSASAILPSWAQSFSSWPRAVRRATNRHHPASPLVLCKLSVVHGSAYFHGRLCSLYELIKAWKLNATTQPGGKGSDGLWDVAFAFDMIPSSPGKMYAFQIPGVQRCSFRGVVCETRRLHGVLLHMISLYPKESLQVLRFGSCPDPTTVSSNNLDGFGKFTTAWRREHDDWIIGLVLRRINSPHAEAGSDPDNNPFVGHYERIGVCRWLRWVEDEDKLLSPESFRALQKVLNGKGRRWKVKEGYWG